MKLIPKTVLPRIVNLTYSLIPSYMYIYVYWGERSEPVLARLILTACSITDIIIGSMYVL